jgi:hypothetical protein
MPSSDNPAWPRRDAAIVIIAVIGAWTLSQLLWPLLGYVVPWDAKLQFFPFFRYLGDSLSSGSFPMWNPYHYAGHPSIADPQSLIFSPIMLSLAWLWPDASMAAFDIAVGVHLLLAGLAMLLLGRHWGYGAAGAALAAIVIMLGGSAAARLQHIGQIFSYSWFVVALTFLAIALDRRSFLAAVLFGLTAGLMAAGRDQVAYLGALMLVLYAVWNLVSQGAPLSRIGSRLPVLIVMFLVGAAVTIVPVLLTAQFAMLSNRPSFIYESITAGSLYPVNLVNLLSANIFGSLSVPYDYFGPGYATRPWLDSTDRSINTIFLGTLPILLILWIGIGAYGLAKKKHLPALVLALFGGAYALGHFTPLFPFMFAHVPGTDLWRRPADGTFLMNIGLAFAAGAMLGRYVEHGRPGQAWLPAALALVILLGGLGIGLDFSTILSKLPQAALEAGITLVLCAAIFALMMRPSMRFERATIAWLLVLFTAGELIFRYSASALNAEPKSFYASFGEPKPAEAAAQVFLRGELARRHAAGEFPRVEMIGIGGTGQNIAVFIPAENTLGYNPVRIGIYSALVDPRQNTGDMQQRYFSPSFPGYDSDLAKRLGVEYLVTGKPLEKAPALFAVPKSAKLLHAGPPWWIYRLPEALPRAVVSSIVTKADQGQITALGEYLAGPDPHRVMVDAAVPLAQDYRGSPVTGKARVVRYGTNSIEIEAEANGPAVLVLHDIFYPGWQAEVNGAAAPVLLVNQLFRGVEIPAGTSRVRFAFRPLSVENIRGIVETIRAGPPERAFNAEAFAATSGP